MFREILQHRPQPLRMFIALVLFVISSPAFASPHHFEHVVMIIQENRTPDNLFGSNPRFEPGVDLATTAPSSDGTLIPLEPVALDSCYDPNHGNYAFKAEYSKGKMNGFERNGLSSKPNCIKPAHPILKYVDNSKGQIQPYFDIAKSYGWANRMFQSNQGPSLPAHQFLISGTSAPDTFSEFFVANNPVGGYKGCLSPETSTSALIDSTGKLLSGVYPCFERPTLTDQLSAAGLTWRWYSSGPASSWNAPVAIQHICVPVDGKCTGTEYQENSIIAPTAVLTDIANCQLANVVWVNPSAQYSDHAKVTTATGPSWVASIVNAIGQSKCGYWKNTAILITWDDWGGWYDHVAPPVITSGWGQGYLYGFRVPLLVVSAYTRKGYVDNATHDFGSMLRFVESNFNLGLIGPGFYADAYADNLSTFFPLSYARAFVAIAAPLKASNFIKSREPLEDPDDE